MRRQHLHTTWQSSSLKIPVNTERTVGVTGQSWFTQTPCHSYLLLACSNDLRACIYSIWTPMPLYLTVINSESCCSKCHWLHERLLSVMYSSGREVFLATARGESEGEQCDQTITSTAAGLLKRDALHGANGATVRPIYTQGKTWTRLKTVHFSVFMYGSIMSPSEGNWCWPECKTFNI